MGTAWTVKVQSRNQDLQWHNKEELQWLNIREGTNLLLIN